MQLLLKANRSKELSFLTWASFSTSLPHRNSDLNSSPHHLMCYTSQKNNAGETSVQLWSKPLIKWLSQEDSLSITDLLCIISPPFKFNGLGEVTIKGRKRYLKRLARWSQLKRFSVHGARLPMSASSSTIKNSLTSRRRETRLNFSNLSTQARHSS